MNLLAPFVYVNVQSWTDVLVLCVIMALAVYWMLNAGSPDNRVYTRQENTLGWLNFFMILGSVGVLVWVLSLLF